MYIWTELGGVLHDPRCGDTVAPDTHISILGRGLEPPVEGVNLKRGTKFGLVTRFSPRGGVGLHPGRTSTWNHWFPTGGYHGIAVRNLGRS